MVYNYSKEDYNDSKISKYNEASFQIMRLNQLWLRAEYYAAKGSLTHWKFILDSIWRELSADILRKDNKDIFILKNFLLIKGIAMSRKRTDLYNSINKRHEFLKEVQDSVGKGGSYQYENSDDFE